MLCIGCMRCVRICRDVRKVDALGFVHDGNGRPVVGTRAPTIAESGCYARSELARQDRGERAEQEEPTG